MIWIALGVLGAVMGAIGFISPLNRHFTYWINSLFPNAELTESQLIELKLRGIIDEKEYFDRMKKLGYDENRSKEFLEISERLLTAEELLVAKLSILN